MPRNAKVFIAENDSWFFQELKKALEQEGHTVIFEATYFREAMEIIAELKEGNIDAAIFDGDLSDEGGYLDHGERLAKATRKKLQSGIIVLAYSLYQQDWSDDKSITKHTPAEEVAKRLTEL